MDYVVVDIETTGLSKSRHKITEIAAIKYQNKIKIDEFTTLINPQTHIPSFITRLTGISDKMVQDKPPITKVMPHFLDFIKDLPFVAHNATFDYNFLSFNAELIAKQLNNPKICTCMLAKRLLPELPTKKLSSLCNHFNIKNEQAHRAMADTIVTGEIFLQFINMLEQKKINTIQKIEKFQTSKIPRY